MTKWLFPPVGRPVKMPLKLPITHTPNEGVGGVFEPGRDLFLPGDILLDYDPADLTTMFQDVNGTQPVTADGQSIALHLDKGQWGGKTLAQLLASQPALVNDDFSSYANTAAMIAADWVDASVGAGAPLAWDSGLGGRAALPRIDGSNIAQIRRVLTTVAGQLYKVTLTASGATTAFRFGTTAGGTQILSSSLAAGTTLIVYIVATTTTTYFQAAASGNATTAYLDDFRVDVIPGYHRTQATGTSQRKYKTDGTLHWSLYDGSDDGDVTPSINWGTDEVAACAGVTKSSDAATSVFFEFSASYSANTGTFAMFAPPAGGNTNLGYFSRGTSSSSASRLLGAAPVTAVVGGNGKISTDFVESRVNGVVSSAVTDQGTGNYGNFPLYFGRRGGASLPFNGREYRTVIRNRLWSATEQAKLEAFIAAKSGVTL